MNATQEAPTQNRFLEFDHEPISYASHPLSLRSDERPRHHESDEHDFDTFVEHQLREGSGSLYADAIAWMERRLLVRVLAQTSGNKSKACQILGITRGSLRHKICQHGISIHQTVCVHDAKGH